MSGCGGQHRKAPPHCAGPLSEPAAHRSSPPHAGCRLVGDTEADSADLWLINSCTVKSPSQSAMDTLLRRGKQLGKALVVAGCVPQVGGAGGA